MGRGGQGRCRIQLLEVADRDVVVCGTVDEEEGPRCDPGDRVYRPGPEEVDAIENARHG